MNFIKKCISLIESPLLHIFSLSIKQGIVPDKFKIAKVVPIFKSGPDDDLNNYRPISLISNFAKILEKIVNLRLIKFLDSNKIISNQQFGFRKDHSTTHPMTLLLNKAAATLNSKKHMLIIFCDLKKAFDTCDLEILIKKLDNIGIHNKELSWFESYLSGRKQYIDIDGVCSCLLDINVGVPQGSILGPLLFVLYINDLPNCSELYSILFADDTALLIEDSDPQKLIERANKEFYKVCTFFRENKLSLHPDKTKYIIISSSQTVQNSKTKIVVNNNNTDQNEDDFLQEIERIYSHSKVPAIKYLGVYFDPCLSFNYHIKILSSKLSRALFILKRVKNLLPLHALLSLYYTLFHSHISYASEIWSSTTQSNLKILLTKQKIDIRTISNLNYNSHTEPHFKNLKILPLDKLLLFSKMKLFQQSIQKTGPIALHNTWMRNRDRRIQDDEYHYELRNDDDFFTPAFRTDTISRLPLHQLPILWNTLPPNIQIIRNKLEFNSKLKTYLINCLSETPNCSRLLCPNCHLQNLINSPT